MSFIFNHWEFEQQATNDTEWLVNGRQTPMTQTYVGALLADGDPFFSVTTAIYHRRLNG